MNDAEKQHARALIEKLVAEAQNTVAQGAYPQALVAIRKAKALDITNIYILAFERQIEQLQELSAAGTLSDDQRNDILESLPGIIDQALATQAPLATPETAEAERRSTPEQLEQMRAARQWLKNQYFQRAHEHVRKQEYERALAELRRVFFIDSEDLFAREFELKIQQMQLLQKPAEPAASAPAASVAPRGENGPAADDAAPASASAVSESEPAEPAPEAGGTSEEPGSTTPGSDGESIPAEDAPRGRSRAVTIALLITIAVIAFAFYYFWKREQPAPLVVPPPSEETEQEIGGDEPIYSIPPAMQIDTVRTDSTQTDTTQTP